MRRGSDANRTRDPALAEALFWDIFRMLQEQDPSFGSGRPKGKLRRFRFRRIYALDSSTIRLVHNCIDWAKHRRKKAALKMHMLTDVPCMLPRCVVIDKARHHDITQATNLCRNLGPGDIVVEDRAYNDWKHQPALPQASVEVEGKLFAPCRTGARGGVAALRRRGTAAILWDSIPAKTE